MPTPSIQTLVTDAQQVLNLDSISAVRSVVAVALANANTGTPLNPNLTTQQLWNEFYQVVTKPKSDIESIIANQLMKFLYSPPAPGGVGANGQVIFNDGGVLAGDPQFLWNKTTNLLTVTGSATITGDLTVDTSTLYVSSSADKVGIGTTSLSNEKLTVAGNISANAWLGRSNIAAPTGDCSIFRSADNTLGFGIASSTAMTLNSTGLGVGRSPSYKLDVAGVGNFDQLRINATSATKIDLVNGTTGVTYSLFNANSVSNGFDGFGIFNGTSYDLRIVSGNVGIGVTPSAWTAGFNVVENLGGSLFSGSTSVIRILQNGYFGTGSYRYKHNNTAAGRFEVDGGVFSFHQAANSGGSGAGTAITFTQAMTLDASGNLLVKKTAQDPTVIGFEAQSNGTVNSTLGSAVNANATFAVYSTGAAAYRFYVGMGGTVYATNTTISAISDARLKENVQDIDVGLGAILALKPRKFDWKAGKGKDIKGDRGFIAQEFEQVFPQLVDEWKDAAPEGEAPYKSVRQDLIPVLVKAIQELTARVQTLETR